MWQWCNLPETEHEINRNLPLPENTSFPINTEQKMKNCIYSTKNASRFLHGANEGFSLPEYDAMLLGI
jgi:hypothetical protein